MWYSVLRREVVMTTSFQGRALLQDKKYRAGSVFLVKKVDTFIRMYKIDAEGTIVDPKQFIILSVGEAREYFTKPTKVLSDAIEESIMVCEGAYC